MSLSAAPPLASETIRIVHFETVEAGVSHPAQGIFEIAHPSVDARVGQHGLPACCVGQFNGILHPQAEATAYVCEVLRIGG